MNIKTKKTIKCFIEIALKGLEILEIYGQKNINKNQKVILNKIKKELTKKETNADEITNLFNELNDCLTNNKLKKVFNIVGDNSKKEYIINIKNLNHDNNRN